MDCTKLAEFLDSLNNDEVSLSIAEIKKILYPEWTESLSKYNAAWHENGHPWTRAWISKGWTAHPKSVNKKICSVVFTKGETLVTKENRLTREKSFVNLGIPQPSVTEVEKYLEKWESLGSYVIQEKALDKLFLETYPENQDIYEVIIKCSALNDFYSTNIFKIYSVAEHILNLNIDENLKAGKTEIVNKIAMVEVEKDKFKNFYSFATKYCSRHNPTEYPIYDYYVEKILRYFRDKDSFYCFENLELKDYTKFKHILEEFRNYYNLNKFNLKQLDKYLWQLGKEYFKKKYK